MANPIFPLNEYVPDGEPHVFGDRVYLYGSHDQEGGDRFCMRDYTVYSAPIGDLENWTNHGVTYRKNQDPRATEDKLPDFYAPDCVQGNDGKYYLYYFAAGPNVRAFGPMAVAVSDTPYGPFEYLGDIKNHDGSPMMMYLTNDPAVINDNGRIWLYYGWGLGRDFRSKLMAPIYNIVQSKIFERPIKEIKDTKPSILSCAVVEMEDDMITVKSDPKAVLDSKTTADKNSEFYHHAFYEAASIRKFNDTYYLVYSSGENSELAYATSKYPDRGFTYRGVLISNSDLGYQGNQRRLAAGGTIHGGVECIDGKYYVFYHRCTNNTDFSRQACAEPIVMRDDGTFEQAEITTQGLHNMALPAKGTWQAVQCCNLFNEKTGTVQGNGHNHDMPTIVCEEEERFITAIDHGTVIGYKYLQFQGEKNMILTIRGGAGKIKVSTQIDGDTIAETEWNGSVQWQEISISIPELEGDYGLYFTYQGSDKIDFKEFTIS